MQYAIDAVLLAVFALTIVIAVKKGFFKSLFDLLAYIVAMCAARFLSAAVAPAIFEQYLSGSIRVELTKRLAASGVLDYSEKIEATVNSIPDYLDGMLQMVGIDKDQISSQISSAELDGDNIVGTLMEKVITPVGTAVVQMLVFVALSLIFRLVLQVVVLLLNHAVKKLPALQKTNAVLGGLTGTVKGFLVVVLAALVISVIASAVKSEPLIQAVDGSLIIKAVRSLITSVSGQVF